MDLSTSILSKYGIKLNIVYKDQEVNGFNIKGVKDFDALRDFLGELINLLKHFPVDFVRMIKWDYLMIS